MRFVIVTPVVFLILAAAAGGASRSVWEGVYSAEQGNRGKKFYNAQCARCHGEAMLGGEDSPPLVDRDFLEKWNGKSVGSLVELTRKTMPSDGLGKLSRSQCADIIAYVLSANGFPAGDSDLGTDPTVTDQILIEPKR